MAADTTLPCWSYRPNWAGGVLEALEWRSSVVRSPKGAEQRRALRLSPRRFLEFETLGVKNSRSNLDLAVWSAGGTKWNLPLWWDSNPLTANATAGATVLQVNTVATEFEVGGLAFIQGPSYDVFDVVKITGKTDTTLTIQAPGTTRAWKAKTKVFPIKQAMMQDQPQTTRYNDGVAAYQTSWQVVETNDHAVEAPTESYLGYPVYRTPSNETGSLVTQWQRDLLMADTGMSIPYTVDTSLFATENRQHEAWMIGRQAHDDFRKMLYYLRGRARALWIPTFALDMELTADIGSAATTFTIQTVGVSKYVNFTADPAHPERNYPGRRHVCIQMRDGTAYFTKLMGATDNLDGTETLSIIAPLGYGVEKDDVLRISFMALMRLNQDRVEINHQTDQAGTGIAAITWVTTPENRNADVMSPTEWDGTMVAGTCGNICAPPIHARNDNMTFEGNYNPVAHELFAFPWVNTLVGTGIWLAGYKWAANSLADNGTFTTENPDNTFGSRPVGFYQFNYDKYREVFWAWARVGSQTYLFKYDALTMACLHTYAVPSGSLFNSSQYGFAIDPADPSKIWLWTPTSVSWQTSICEFDPATETWGTGRLVSGYMFPYGNDSCGYFLKPGELWMAGVQTTGGVGTDPDMTKKLRKFNVSTGVMSTEYQHTAEIINILPGPDADVAAGKVWLQMNSGQYPDEEIDVSGITPALTGRKTLDLNGTTYARGSMPVWDDVNNRWWTVNWWGDGGIFSYSMDGTDRQLWVYFASDDPPLPPPVSPGDYNMVEGTSYPKAGVGKPNSVYYEVETWDESVEDYAYTLHKMPTCQRHLVTV